jgi:hypothetical protein
MAQLLALTEAPSLPQWWADYTVGIPPLLDNRRCGLYCPAGE